MKNYPILKIHTNKTEYSRNINDSIKNKDHKINEKRNIEIKPLNNVIEVNKLIKPILIKIDVQGL